MQNSADSVSTSRESAARVAKWLVEKSRPDEAVALLARGRPPARTTRRASTCWPKRCASIRAPASRRWRSSAWRAMQGDHGELDAAIARFPASEARAARSRDEAPELSARADGLQQQHQVPRAGLPRADRGLGARSAAHHHAPVRRRRARHQEPQARLHGARHARRRRRIRARADEVAAPRDGDGAARGPLRRRDRRARDRRHGSLDRAAERRHSRSSRARRSSAPRRCSSPAPIGRRSLAQSRRPVARSRSLPPRTAKRPSSRCTCCAALSGGPERYDPPGTEAIIGAAGAVSLPGERFCAPRKRC